MNNQGEHDKRAAMGRGALVLVLLIAGILRAIGANSEFWFDEIATVLNYVRPPLRTLLSTYGSPNNHVFNSVLAQFSVGIFGSEQPWVVRLPSILFGIASVWAFHFVARQLWTSQVALIGTFMFAVSYHGVYYTQQARGYSMFLFFALLATGLLLRMVLTPDRNRNLQYGLGYALAVAFGTYSLLLMTFVMMGHGLILLVARRWGVLNWLLAGLVLTLLLYAPMLHGLIKYYSQHPAYTGVPLLSLAFFNEIRPMLPALIIATIVLPFAMGRLWNKLPLATALLVAPAAFSIIIPLIRGQGVHPRSFMYGLPLAYLLITELIDWGRRYWRWTPAPAAAAAAVISLVALVPYYSVPKQGFRQALAYISAHRGPDDRTIGLRYGGKAVRFYDPSVVLIENSGELREWSQSAREKTWIVYSFEGEMRESAADLYTWVISSTTNEKRFPSSIGDGSVYVRLWIPRQDISGGV